MSLLGRIFVVLFGYIVAAIAAAAFLAFLWLGPFASASEAGSDVVFAAVLGATPIFFFFTVSYAFVPAMAAIVLAEALALRDWLYFAAAGAVAGISVAGYGWFGGYSDAEGDRLSDVLPVFSDTALALGVIGSGIVAGIAYWAVAGRSSAAWRGGAQV
jgi:hypothetical protein